MQCLSMNNSKFLSPGPCTSRCADPQPPPAAGRAFGSDSGLRTESYNGHYWVGATFSGTSFQSTSIYTTITTPSSGPRYNDYYYELLSAWDTSNNYDQIGISSTYCSTSMYSSCQANDDWSVIYSEGTPSGSSGCHLVYNFNPVWFLINVYSDYTFEMTLTGSNLHFQVFGGYGITGPLVQSTNLSDSAGHFSVSSTYSCRSVNQYGQQVYEEVYNASSSLATPQWNSGFAYTFAGATQITSWTRYSSPSPYTPPTSPHGYYIDFPNSNLVRVDNVATWIGYPWDNPTVAPGGWYQDNGTLNADGSFCSGTSCPFTETCNFPAFSLGGSGSYGYYLPTDVPDSFIDYQGSIPSSGVPPGLYYSECTVTITSTTPNEFTTFVWYTDVT